MGQVYANLNLADFAFCWIKFGDLFGRSVGFGGSFVFFIEILFLVIITWQAECLYLSDPHA